MSIKMHFMPNRVALRRLLMHRPRVLSKLRASIRIKSVIFTLGAMVLSVR